MFYMTAILIEIFSDLFLIVTKINISFISDKLNFSGVFKQHITNNKGDIMSVSFMGSRPYENKNVKLHLLDSNHGKYADELYYAQDVIGNYAKANKSEVVFMEGAEMSEVPAFKQALKDSLYIGVENRKTKKSSGNVIKYVQEDGKPFLRRVYESLQQMIEGTQPKIEAHKSETVSKLIKSGKMKA